MGPTVSSVFDGARARLGDAEGQVFTDAKLTPFYKAAYRELFARLVSVGASDVIKTIYYNLSPYVVRVTPEQMGALDLDEPLRMWERKAGGLVAVTATSATEPVVVTAPGHSFSNKDEIVLSRIGPEVDGRWYVNVIDANTFYLIGSSSSVAYVTASGTTTKGTGKFTIVYAVDELRQDDPRKYLGEYEYEGGAFHFPPASEARQIKLEYKANGEAPLTGRVGLVGSGNFLEAKTAALAAERSGAPQLSMSLNAMCYGVPPRVMGYLDDAIRPAVISMQRQCYRPRAFRQRRRATY